MNWTIEEYIHKMGEQIRRHENAEHPPHFQGFIRAIQDGNLEAVKKFLQQPVDVDSPDSADGEARFWGGGTALTIAAETGHLEIVELLLKAGASIHAQTWRGETALGLAVRHGYTEIVERLICAGAEVNMILTEHPCWPRYTPLMQAAASDYTKLVKILLDAGAEVNCRDRDGWSALMLSVAYGHDDCMDYLVSAGASDNKLMMANAQLYRAVCEGNEIEVKRMLKAKASPNATPEGAWTPLLHAAENGDLGIVKALIKAGADIHARTAHEGYPVIIQAVFGGSIAVLEELLKAGAGLEPVTSSGATPLTEAARIGNIEMVQKLLELGANTSAEAFCMTPLVAAATFGHPEVIRQLVQAGVNPNQQTSTGEVALHNVVRHGNMELAEVLIQLGADPYIKNKKGESPLDIARAAGNIQLIEVLTNRNP